MNNLSFSRNKSGEFDVDGTRTQKVVLRSLKSLEWYKTKAKTLGAIKARANL